MEYICENCGNRDKVIDDGEKWLFENDGFLTVEFLGQQIGLQCSECKTSENLDRFVQLVNQANER